MHQGLSLAPETVVTKPQESIPVAGPWITEKEVAYVTDAVTHCWGAQANRYHDAFEEAFASYVGRAYAITLPSCTSAIHLSLAALNIGPGDEVIVPDVTWIASSAPVQYVGADLVFADVDRSTWCLSADAFQASITKRTKGVIVVDLYGNMPEMDAIIKIAKEHQIAVIEDAAEAFGSSYRNQMAGSFGETSVFSFHGSKTMTTGEGGVLVTDCQDLHRRILFLRDHGRVPGDVRFRNREVAYKYKASSMQAALGLAQVERAEELVGRKRELFSWYADRLSDVQGLTLNQQPEGTRNSYWMVTALLDSKLGIRKEALQKNLSDHGIDTRPFFHPLSSIPAYQNLTASKIARSTNHVAYEISPYGINLPSAMSLTEIQVDYICERLQQSLHSSAHLQAT